MTPFYAKVYKHFAKALRRLFRMEIIGAENEPPEGGYIACSNHLSNADVVIVAAALTHQVRFFAKAELFKVPGLKQFITALGAFPVHRGAADVSSIKNTLRLLSEGEVVGFYPQGHRYPGINPAKTEAKAGIGLIAARSHAKILPINVSTKGWRIRPFKRTVITIGKPIDYEELGFVTGDKTEYEAASKLIFGRVTALCAAEDGNIPKNSAEDKA